MIKYGPAVEEAIWVLMCEGHKPKAITEKLAEGKAGLPTPIDMKPRTLRYKMRRLKEKRGEPGRVVAAGKELDQAQEIRRELLAILATESHRLRGISGVRPLTAKELDQLDRAARTVARLEKDLSTLAPEPTPIGPSEDAFLNDLEAELGTKSDDLGQGEGRESPSDALTEPRFPPENESRA